MDAGRDFFGEAWALAAELVAWRRHFHAHPELSGQEKETAARVAAELERLGLAPQTGLAGTHGLYADLAFERPGPTVLLRADMDALPLTEEGERPYLSQNPGVAHACGHDAHMACLLGAVKLLKGAKGLAGRVRFLFQPMEETPPGGALPLIQGAAILDGVDKAAALHVYNSLPSGQVGFFPGVYLAHSSRFQIEIEGSGGHAAKPHQGVDALAAAVQVYQALQYLVSRQNDPLEPLVISVGMMSGGTAPNVLAAKARMEGTTRCLDGKLALELPQKMERVVGGVCQAAGARHRFAFQQGYPALCNDPALTEEAMALAVRLLGQDKVVRLARPEMGGEDFAHIAARVPAVFIRLGTGNPQKGINRPQHHPAFDLDEDALPVGAALLAQLAAGWCQG